ncbi:hypothetical protein HMN09_00215700 [Mycena chlorophos]|uniref:NAD(P)-binding protein n=1 Tax=Mycena chlorophos TaxID=658473 RepID=A0A8H6WNI6_MYCCL|nr:hypothetical protein HMN09_00215700 [Mycena chlorophos]
MTKWSSVIVELFKALRPSTNSSTMPSFAEAQADNASWVLPNTYTPTFVVVGGTSGIGEGIAQALGRHTKGNAHLLIVGRNGAAAQKTFFGMPSPKGITHEFVECDLSSIATVKRVCASLVRRFPRINLLVMTAGAVDLGSSTTSEGLERASAIVYYARWAFVDGLLPALLPAKEAGEDARVFSVLNAGMGKPIDFDDLGLKKKSAEAKSLGTLVATGSAMATYMDYMVMSYAKRYPYIPFAHASPGGVNTPLWGRSPSLSLRLMGLLIKVMYFTRAKSITECGEHQVYALRHIPAGASWTTPDGDDFGNDRVCGGEKEAEMLWAHTVEVVGAIHA